MIWDSKLKRLSSVAGDIISKIPKRNKVQFYIVHLVKGINFPQGTLKTHWQNQLAADVK